MATWGLKGLNYGSWFAGTEREEERKRHGETDSSKEDSVVSLYWKCRDSFSWPYATRVIKYHDGGMFPENNGVGLFALLGFPQPISSLCIRDKKN